MPDLLKQPYPHDQAILYHLRTITGISLFSFLFLWYFEPFGIHLIARQERLAAIAGYSATVFAVLGINMLLLPVLLPRLFVEEKWTVMHEIGFCAVNFSMIGLALFLYASYRADDLLPFSGLLRFQLYSVVVGIGPVTILTLLNQNRLLKRNLAMAVELDQTLSESGKDRQSDAEVSITSENENDSVEVPLRDLLYVQSIDNYILVYWQRQGSIEKSLLRSSLRAVEHRVTAYPQLFRCHRAYLVNLQRIKSISGNSQGYRLTMEGTQHEIPVARSRSRQFRETLKQIR